MKYAVVTGATKGIGRAIAQRLLREGWYVFANYAHDDQAAEAFVRELPENLRGGHSSSVRNCQTMRPRGGLWRLCWGRHRGSTALF